MALSKSTFQMTPRVEIRPFDLSAPDALEMAKEVKVLQIVPPSPTSSSGIQSGSLSFVTIEWPIVSNDGVKKMIVSNNISFSMSNGKIFGFRQSNLDANKISTGIPLDPNSALAVVAERIYEGIREHLPPILPEIDAPSVSRVIKEFFPEFKSKMSGNAATLARNVREAWDSMDDAKRKKVSDEVIGELFKKFKATEKSSGTTSIIASSTSTRYEGGYIVNMDTYLSKSEDKVTLPSGVILPVLEAPIYVLKKGRAALVAKASDSWPLVGHPDLTAAPEGRKVNNFAKVVFSAKKLWVKSGGGQISFGFALTSLVIEPTDILVPDPLTGEMVSKSSIAIASAEDISGVKRKREDEPEENDGDGDGDADKEPAADFGSPFA